MIDVPLYMGASCISALIVLGIIETHVYATWLRALWSMASWSALVGGGFYGLCIFDAQLVEGPLSFATMIAIMVGTLLFTLVGRWLLRGSEWRVD